MSSTLYRIARACYRARRRVLAAWLLVILALGVGKVALGGTFDDAFSIPGRQLAGGPRPAQDDVPGGRRRVGRRCC